MDLRIAVVTCLALSGCANDQAGCWTPDKLSPELDRATLAMIASTDRSVQASGYGQRAQRCIDKLASLYGRGRDSAEVIAGAVVEESRSDSEIRATIESYDRADVEGNINTAIAVAKRRATILIVRDRAA